MLITDISKITAEQSYMLGFIWGDGYIDRNLVRIEILKKDGEELFPIFAKNGDWRSKIRIRENRQEQMRMQIYNPEFVKLLNSHNYVSGKATSPDSLINEIPKHLQKFWYLGFLDADGCWYYNTKQKLCQCSFSSRISQDWYFMENIFIKLGIKYSINKNKTKTGNSSVIRITNKKDVFKLGEYLYKDNNLGLIRKRIKFNSIPKVL